MMKKLIWLLVIVVIVVGGAYLLTQKKAEAPMVSVPADWLTYQDTQNGFEFKYPEKLPTTYVKTQEWPPKVTVTAGTSTCSNTSTNPAFCVTKESDAAAGTEYINYSYTVPLNGKLVTFSFTLRQPNGCGVYQNSPDLSSPENQKYNECLEEEKTFSVDNLVTQIFSTFTFTK